MQLRRNLCISEQIGKKYSENEKGQKTPPGKEKITHAAKKKWTDMRETEKSPWERGQRLQKMG